MNEAAEPPGRPAGGAYPPADARRRALARLVDLPLCLAPLWLAGSGYPVASSLAAAALLLSNDSLFGPGRSLGKRLFGLRTIVLRTRRPGGWRTSALRNLIFVCALVPAFAGAASLLAVLEVLGALAALEALVALQPLTKDLGQRRLGDLLAGTQVIDASIPIGLGVEAPARASPPATPLSAAPQKAARAAPPEASLARRRPAAHDLSPGHPRDPACASP